MNTDKTEPWGILIVDKSQGWTSHDCIAVARRALGIKKIGHTGTLDPMATGLLPLCIGRATRVIEYLEEDEKVYEGSFILGIETDTEDIWGKVLRKSATEQKHIETMYAEAGKFSGEMLQKPPMYSAIKVGGRKLYNIARSGESAEINSRRIFVHSFILGDVRHRSLEVERTEMTVCEVDFTVKVSKGTYVRSICRDLGQLSGCGASMSRLRRISSGSLKLPGLKPEDLKVMRREEILKKIIPVEEALSHMPKVFLTGDEAERAAAGQKIFISPDRWEKTEREIYISICDGQIVSAGYRKEDRLISKKVFI